jgi:integrase
VPLTPQAVRLLRVLWRPGRLLMVSNGVLDALFRKMRDQLLLPDLHFHDSRATALTHLAKRVDVMVLARISGHKNLSLLHGTYYRESAEQIAARLASPRR